MALFVESAPCVYKMDQNVANQMRQTLDSHDLDSDMKLRQILETEQSGMDAYIQQGTEIVEDVVERLKRGQNLGSIQRNFLGGSVAKGTSVGPAYKPDLDLYLFFQYGSPQGASNAELEKFIQEKLNDIKRVLASAENRNQYQFVFKSKFAVIVKHVESGMKVDVIPAIKFGLGDSQYKFIIRREARAAEEVGLDNLIMTGRDSNLKWINSTSAELNVKYVQKQGQFVRDVIVLAKYWNKKCVRMRNISGRSYVVELVAMKAAQEEVEDAARARVAREPFLVRALLKFFEMMAQESMELSVYFKDGLEELQIPSDVGTIVMKRRMWFEDPVMAPSNCLIDPVMPFRDLLKDDQLVGHWQDFQNAAAASLEIIHQEGAGEGKSIEEAFGFAM